MPPETKVTIAIPTYNRSELLKINLKSVLTQDYPDFQVLVLDNASTDDTEAVVRSLADSRVTYIFNETNIGPLRNFNQAIELNSSPYLNIIPDDDAMLPGFIQECVLALDNYPSAALSVTGIRGVDINGDLIPMPDDPAPVGLISGLEYLHEIVAGRNWVIHASSVMMRSSALKAVGFFDTPHSRHSNDLNLYLRMVAQYDIVFVPKELSQVRIHAGQDTQMRFHSPGGTGPLATMAERTDAIAYLLQSPRAEDASYRQWLAERLLHMSMRRSEFTSQLVPKLNLSWSERLQIAIREIAAVIPTGKCFILVDENQWGAEIFPEFDALPFLEHEGQYWGAPPDDQTAIREVERMRDCGASFMVIGWPAFWWLDYYSKLRNYLSSNFRCVLHNSRLIVFDLQP
jgi:glycosyltransferase involved in cell wall biosynthesis